jgi:exopolyphosphatase/guanosine-5'-triphosphate,3'-diphosphate pyrophosphatase
MFIRLCESLDRSHAGFVQHAEFVRAEKNEVVLNIVAESDCQLEIWGVEAEQRTFERVFSKRLKIEIIAPHICDGQKDDENNSDIPVSSVKSGSR